MVSGVVALVLLLVAVVAIVILTGRYKVNAFLVLVAIAFCYGLAIGLPALDVVKYVKEGFGGTLTSIGIVIVAGTIMGTILEKTGAALSMTQAILRLVGKERSPLAMSAAGYVVSVPVFCDSGFVILNPLNRALAKETGTSMAVMAVALATGLYATHTMVPPTPGPIAAAGALSADLGKVILLGLIAAVPAAAAGWFWATRFARRYPVTPHGGESYQDLMARYGTLPPAWQSFMPIVVPILLILLKSVAEFPSKPFGSAGLQKTLSFIGDPVIALLAGMLLSLTLIRRREDVKEGVSTWMNAGVKDSAIILVVTAAGGSLGRILAASPLKDFISQTLANPTLGLGLLLPFIVSAALKTAQGSSTVAIITTANIMAPLLGTLGIDPALTVIVIGAGSMVVSHANDSFFWVVSQFSDLEVNTAYKVYTSATAIEGAVAFGAAWIMSFFV